MSSVDDRIVNMQFNNKNFTQGAADSKKSLEDLEKATQNMGKSQGLTQMGNEVTGLSKKFSVMQVAGVTAVATIANKAVNAGLRIAKSFTLDPIKQGFQEYQTNLKSIQTVMANTGKSVNVVNKYLGQLNTYADKTIYSFSEMAKNVGTFTAAGVGLKQSVASIQGISNLAALSGSTAQQAASAMYQLSQAIAAGRVNLQDWNSVVNAGMGGKNFQKALIITGSAMGNINRQSVDLGKNIKIAGESFRESISSAGGGKTWLDSDVLTKSLNLLDGRLSKTALMDKGFTEEQAKAEIQKQKEILKTQGYRDNEINQLVSLANRAYESATVVKTLPDLMSTTKEAIGSLWASSFQNIMGNFNQSKRIWTNASHSISHVVGRIGQALNGVKDPKIPGSKDGILTMFTKTGTSEFAGKASSARINAVVGFSHVMQALGKVLGTVGDAFADVFPNSGAGIAGVLINMTTAWRKFSNEIQPSAETLDRFKRIFSGVFAVLHIGFTVVKLIATAFGALFGELFKGASKGSGGVLEFLANIGDMLVKLDDFLTSGGKMVEIFEAVGEAAGKFAGEGIAIATNFVAGIANGLVGGEAFGQLKDAIVSVATNLVEWIKGALGIHSPAAELIPVGVNIAAGIGEGILKGVIFIITALGKVVAAIFKGLGQAFSGMDSVQLGQTINGILAGGFIFAMTRLTGSFGGIFKDLRKHMLLIRKEVTGTFEQMQNTLKAAAIKSIAIAIGILVASLIAMQFVDTDKLISSTAAIGVLMTMMVVTMSRLAKIGDVKSTLKGTVTASAQLAGLSAAVLVMAQAMAIMALSVTLLAQQDPTKVAYAVGVMATMMAIMINNMARLAKMGPLAERSAAIMLSMATSMAILTGSIIAMALIPFGKLIKGVAIVAITLGVLVGAMLLLSNFAGQATVSALALIALAIAINMISAAIILLSGFSWETILSGLLKLGLILVGLAAAALLAPALSTLGAALIILGAAFFLAGTGMFLFATGFALLTATGVAGVAILTAAFEAFLALLPTFAIQIAAAFVSFIEAIAAATPRVRKALGTILKNILGVVTDTIPQIQKVFQALIDAAILTVRTTVPQWISAGLYIMKRFLEEVADNVPSFVDSGKDIVLALIEGLGKASSEIVTGTFLAILEFLEALDQAIVDFVPQIRDVGLRIAGHIVDGMTFGLAGKAKDLAGNLAKGVGKVGGFVGGFLPKISVRNKGRENEKVWTSFGQEMAYNLASGITRSQGTALTAMFNFLNTLNQQGTTLLKKYSEAAIRSQQKSDVQSTYADLIQKEADKAATTSDRAQNNKKLSKKQKKALANRAKQLQKKADQQAAAAEAAQLAADKAAEELQDRQDIDDAIRSKDYNRAGEILQENAEDRAKEAATLLASSKAKIKRANELRGKANKAARDLLIKQAKADAAKAAALAQESAALQREALDQFAEDFQARIDALDKFAEDRKWQAEFDKATADEQARMLNERASKQEELAKQAQDQANVALQNAKNAGQDAALADRWLSEAEAKTKEAADAADAAKRDRDQAKSLLGQNNTPAGSIVQPSRSALEDASRAFDTYTASMVAAQLAAQGTQDVIQFVQNNYSPEALSASEIYRQSNNLIAAASVKMGG